MVIITILACLLLYCMKEYMKTYVIIGAGIIGCTLARELLLHKVGKVILLEKENKFGLHSSGRNSCVIHSGINQKPGTLKAQMCLDGSRMIREYCVKNNIPMEKYGTLVISQNEVDEMILEKLMKMGLEAGVKDLQFLNKNELIQKEPLAIGQRALFSPTGAVVDTDALLGTIVDEIESLQGKLYYNERVTYIDFPWVITDRNRYQVDYLINCAGLYSDNIAEMMGIGKKYSIVPFRGEYYEVKDVNVNSMIYKAPDLRFPFLSVHLTKLVNGKVIAGPTATLSLGRESYQREFKIDETLGMLKRMSFYKMITKKGFLQQVYHSLRLSLSKKTFKKEIESLIGEIQSEQLFPYRSGIRPQLIDENGNLVNDFIIESNRQSLHVLNCISPGFTCSFAFAKYLNSIIIDNK